MIASLVLTGLTAAGAATAQTPPAGRLPPRDTPPAAAIGSAKIQGQVIATDSKRPLRRAQVTLSAPSLGNTGRTTSTDDEGRYEFTDLPAGRYGLAVSRSGYLTLRYGQRRPFEQGKQIDVADRQALDRIDFALPRMSLISGRLTDELGDPIAAVRMYALRLAYFDGRRRFVPMGPATFTDEGGEYRIGGLVPSTYIVVAQTREKWTVTTGDRQEVMGYAPTYFPGTTNAAEARRVTVGVGEEAGTVDFSLIPGRAAKVSGTALTSRGEPLSAVVLVQATVGPNGGTTGLAGGATAAADGSFTIADVPPGEYTLQASGSQETAMMPMIVDGIDIANVSLVGSGGWGIRGTITTESGEPPDLPRGQVRLIVTPVAGRSFMGTQGMATQREAVNADWSFEVTGVIGAARLGVALPVGWAMKAMLDEGRDIADQPIERRSGDTLSKVRMVLSNRTAKLEGEVTGERGVPSADGTVIVFPADSAKSHEGSRFVRAVRPDDKGRYQIDGLMSGDYLAIAMDYVEQGVWNDPEYLDSLRARTVKVRVAEGETQTLPLPLVAFEEGR